ncbi:unnamed protein product, partial [Polarella glacialis]
GGGRPGGNYGHAGSLYPLDLDSHPGSHPLNNGMSKQDAFESHGELLRFDASDVEGMHGLHSALKLQYARAEAAEEEVARLRKALQDITPFVAIRPVQLQKSVMQVASYGTRKISWRQGYTALHQAAAESGRQDVLALLLSMGADPYSTDSLGRTAFD